MRHKPRAAACGSATATSTSRHAQAQRRSAREALRRPTTRTAHSSQCRAPAPSAARRAISRPISKPDSQSSTSVRRELAHQRERARAERRRAQVRRWQSARHPASERIGQRSNAVRRCILRRRRVAPAGRGCCAPSSTAYISPVMNVTKSSSRPAVDERPFAVRAGQHDERAWRVGPHARRAICVSSPRMTSGMPSASRVRTPGTIASARSARCDEAAARGRSSAGGHCHVGRLDPALAAADHAARKSRRGIVVPIAEQRVQAQRQIGRPAPAGCRAAPARSSSTAPIRVKAVRARRRRAPVDRKECAGWIRLLRRHEPGRSCWSDADQAGAGGPLPSAPQRRRRWSRASTQRAPSASLPSSRTARASSGSP